MPFSQTASHRHGATGVLDNVMIETRQMDETMDAVDRNLDRLKLSLQKRYSELVSSQIDRLMDRAVDPNRKVYVNIKSREIRKLGTSCLDIPAIGSGSENAETPDQASVGSESKVEKTPEITRIKIRQYRKIEHSDGEKPESSYSTDQDANDANKITHEKITFREKVIGQLSAEKDKYSGLSDSVSAFKSVVPHTHEMSTYMGKNLSENINKRPMSATHPIGSHQFTSERSLTTNANRSPILARNYARSTTPAFTISVRPVQENNSTQSKNNASPLAENGASSLLPSRNDDRSPISTRRDGASPLNKYDARSPASNRSSGASPLNRYDAKSPALGRSSEASPLNRYNARSRALGQNSEASPPLHRYDANSPALGRRSEASPLSRYNARSPALDRSSEASPSPNRYDAKSPSLGRNTGADRDDVIRPLSIRNVVARSPPLARIRAENSASTRIGSTSAGKAALTRSGTKSQISERRGAESPTLAMLSKSPNLERRGVKSLPSTRHDAESHILTRGSAGRPSMSKKGTGSHTLAIHVAESPMLPRSSPTWRRRVADKLELAGNRTVSTTLSRGGTDTPIFPGRDAESPKLSSDRAFSPTLAVRRGAKSPEFARNQATSPTSARTCSDSLILLRRDTDSPILIRRDTESPTLTRNRSNSVTSARRGTESPTLQKSHSNSPTPTRNGTESPTLPRSRLNSPTPTRRGTESPTLPRSRLSSPTSALRGTESPTLPRSRLNSPTSARRGAESPTPPRSRNNSPTSAQRGTESLTLPRSRLNSPTPTRRGAESPTLPRSRLNSPTSARRGTESFTLPGSRLNSPTTAQRGTENPTLPRSRLSSPTSALRGAEIHRLSKSHLNSPTQTRRDAESHTLPRSRLNSPTLAQKSTERRNLSGSRSHSPTSARRGAESPILPGSRLTVNSPTSARRGTESPTLPRSRLNSPTSTIRGTESPTLAPSIRNSRSSVWKEYLGYDFVNDANSAALVRPTSTGNHVERRLRRMVDRLEVYNRSVSPKMEKIKESLSPRKPLRDNYVIPAIEYYVEEPIEKVESTKSVQHIKQKIPSAFNDKNMTDTRENIEYSMFTSLPNQNSNIVPRLALGKKGKDNFEEQYNDYVTDRMVVAGKEYTTTSYNTPEDEVGVKYSRKGKVYQSFDVDSDFSDLRQRRKPEPPTEFQPLISPVSDDQTSETRDIVKRLVFSSSPTQSPADSFVASDSGNSRAVCLVRKSADGSENKMSTYLQNESRKDIGRYRRPIKQSEFKTSTHLQNESRKNLSQHRRPTKESELKTSDGSIQIQRCRYDRSNFPQYTVSDNSFCSNLQQSSENSTFLFDSLDDINQQPLAHSTPVPEDRTVLFSPISQNNELQPDGIQEIVPLITESEEYCACCRDKETKENDLIQNPKKYLSQSNKNEENYQLDKIKKSDTNTRMGRSRDYQNKYNTIPSSSRDTKKDPALSLYTNRIENGKESSGKHTYHQQYKSKANGTRFEELVKHQLHQLRDPNDHQNNLIGRKTNGIKESEPKEMKDYDNDNQANVTEEQHLTFKVIRKRIFPVDNECSQTNITQAQKHLVKRIEKENAPVVVGKEAEKPFNHQTHRASGQQKHPVTLGTQEIKTYKNSTQANYTRAEQEMQKLVKQRIFRKGLDTERDNIENIAPEEKPLKQMQAAGNQRTHIFTSKTKEIKQYGNGNQENFRSLEIQTRSSTGSQTESLREDTDIHRNEQSSQTEVYMHSESSIKHTQSTNTDEYSFYIDTEEIKAENVQNKSNEEEDDDESENRKTTAAAKAADNDFQIEIWIAFSANVHRLYEDIERVISTNALPKDDIPPETTISEAKYMLLNRIETLLSLCSNLDRNEFREQIEELICRLHGACFEQGARSRDSDYMDEMRTVLDGLTILKENLAVGRERLPDEKSGDFGSSGFIATASKTFKRLLEYYSRNRDGGTRIIRRIGQRTELKRLPVFLQRHLYKIVLVLGIILGIGIVFFGPSVARAMSNFIFSRFMNVLCNVRLIHYNPPIV